METTLNMRTDISEKITLAARLRGISRSEMTVILIKKVMDDISNPGRMGRMVQYQKRCRPDEWYTFHLQVREDDYEYFLDLVRHVVVEKERCQAAWNARNFQYSLRLALPITA